VGSEETRTDSRQPDSGGTGNVVRIPREWFGPPDELVPFGPRARHVGPRPSVEPDPNTFWGEDAGSIQDAVEAPPTSDALRPRHRLGPQRIRSAGLGYATVAGATAVLMLAGVGLVTWLLAGSQTKTFRPAIASIPHVEAVGQRQLMVPRTTTRSRGAQTRTLRRTDHHRRPTGTLHSAASTPVIYHPSQPASSGLTEASYSPSRSTGTSGIGGSGTGAVATAASGSQSSQSAYGANGALGPMSSPAG
jgi:hypothetical protein